MTQYEMLAVLPGTLTETEVAPMVATLKETIEKFGAEQTVVHPMGKSRLAYPMKHIRYGYFYVVHFSCEETKVHEVEARARLLGSALRLTVQVIDAKKPAKDMSKLVLTPLATVIVEKDETTPTREPRRDNFTPKTRAPELGMVVEKVVTAQPTVNIEEIDQKLDQILEKDLENV